MQILLRMHKWNKTVLNVHIPKVNIRYLVLNSCVNENGPSYLEEMDESSVGSKDFRDERDWVENGHVNKVTDCYVWTCKVNIQLIRI